VSVRERLGTDNISNQEEEEEEEEKINYFTHS
jgi:hypothetical protein